MNRSEIIMARFLALHPKLIDLKLDRMWRLLELLGNPHQRLPPVIHVAGTNGKGSTIAFMRAFVEASGRTAHVYTSPHLVRFHERIRLGAIGGGRLVGEDALVDAFSRAEAANGDSPITVFEITTIAALLLFAQHPADVLLLEVGLGGRFDATNVVDRPAATVVTSVSMDHMEYLGDTVEKIAFEKAGIFKRGVPAILAEQAPAPAQVLEAEAGRVGAPLILAGQDYAAHTENGRLVFQDGDGLLDLPLPRLAGRHQHANAATAIAAMRTVFGPRFPPAAIEHGLTHVEWPGRLQRLTGGPLVEMGPAQSEIWLDGGHNEDGGRVLSEALADFEDKSPRPLIMIAGMLSTKDSTAFFARFKGLLQDVVAVPNPGQPASRTAEDLAAAAALAGLKASTGTSIEQALSSIAKRQSNRSPRIIITGSLYLAGEVLRLNGNIPE